METDIRVCEIIINKQDKDLEIMTNIIMDDSFDSKCKELSIGDELKLSLLSGLVQPNGASKYVLDDNFSSGNSRVTLHFRCITNVENSTIDVKTDFQPQNSQELQATHIVSEVYYGFEVFFVFDKHVEPNKVHETAQSIKQAITGKFNSNETERLFCTFYGDFDLPEHVLSKPHTCITEVTNLCSQFITLFNEGEIKSVPLKATLCPLRKFVAIETGIKGNIKDMVTNLKHMSLLCTDVEDEIYKSFDVIRCKLVKLKGILSEYEETLTEDIGDTLPSVRADTVHATEKLEKLLDKHHSSPFNYDRVSSWMKRIKEEIKQCLGLLFKGEVNFNVCILAFVTI